MDDNQRLAELLGNELCIVESLRCNWQPDMDAADMQDVYPLLKERGLFGDMVVRWSRHKKVFWVASLGESDEGFDLDVFFAFLNDLPGQVKAAIEVLGEEKVKDIRLTSDSKAGNLESE